MNGAIWKPWRLEGTLVAIALSASSGCAHKPADADAVPPRSVPLVAVAERPAARFAFAPGDEFDLRVPEAPQLDQSLRVRPDGSVSVPTIGTVRMQGRSVDEVQAELRERLERLAGAEGGRDYLLHANDEIELKFPFQPTLNEVVRVRPDGKVQLQLAGTVQAEGRSPEELQTELAKRYARWLRRPELSVIVRTATSRSVRVGGVAAGGIAGLRGLEPVILLKSVLPPQVFVGGEVGRPGVLAYRPGLSLMQALVEAGGALPTGDPGQLTLLRRSADDGVEVVAVGFDAQRPQAITRDVLLQPYDVVVLPKHGAATLADRLNQYVFNLVPFLRNSSFGFSYQINGYRTP